MKSSREWVLFFCAFAISCSSVLAQEKCQKLKVVGFSMMPTLAPYDEVSLGAKRACGSDLRRGDLVALRFSTVGNLMVKRIVAVAGDAVVLEGEKLRVAGSYLMEINGSGPRIFCEKATRVLSIQLARYENRVPEGCFLVMGDNSSNSFDSSDYGFVSSTQIVGRVFLKERGSE